MKEIHEYSGQYIRNIKDHVLSAGVYAKESYRKGFESYEKPFGDIVTDVDHACEKIIIDGIHKHYPRHRIISEEIGEIYGDHEWTWIVDPLDGTHNFTSGIPLFGMIVSLYYEGSPIAAILYDAWQGDMILGGKNLGVVHNARPLPIFDDILQLGQTTVGWTQGYAVQDDPTARKVRDCVESQTKRLITTWSPVIDTIRVLNGQFGAIVSFDGEFTDMSAARALIPELGGAVHRFSRAGEDRRFVVGPSHLVRQIGASVEKISGL